MNYGVLLDAVERIGGVAAGGTVTVALTAAATDAETALLTKWCVQTGNELIDISGGTATLRRGRHPDPLASLAPEQLPGTRLWMYTNFDCNLACDYCCVRSSPRTARRALGVDRVRQLAMEAVEAGVSELILTGGEPFLLPDIDEVVTACTAALPTILLTNGMLLSGRRLERLRRMDRNRLTLQISLDSATPTMHDQHRGPGSWQRAVAGIHTAQTEGFRVRVAATLPADQVGELDDFHVFLDSLGILPDDQVIRAVAHRGVAESGLELTVEGLIPEVTVTADGIYWHPVTADHDDQFVTRDIFPLTVAIAEVRRRFLEYRRQAEAAAAWFPCA